MKKIIFASIVFALCVITKTHAQQLESIPDVNLRNALMSKFPECFSGNLLDVSCEQINHVDELNVSNLGIADLSGIQFFKRLQYLKCSNNNLTTLDAVLPDSLLSLDCAHNQLTSLPDLPDSLQTLVCSYNKLTALPVLPINMDLIHCYNNELTQLPDFPNTFSTLWADDNKITSLPPLPDSLRYISLIRNELTTFPAVSTTANKISYINVSANKISTVPVQAVSLEFLEISENLITELPALPSGLLSLGCSKNQITCLPFLPLGLKWLGFRENPITCIPNMPPNLTYFKGTTTIICTAANTAQNNCTYYVPVTGTVFIDYNGNNTQDAEDTGVRDILLYSTKADAQHTLTDAMGNFTLYLPEGSYIYRANVIDTLFTPPSVRLIKVVNGVPSSTSYNYNLIPTKEIKDITVTATALTPPRPGFKTSYTITYANTGNYPVTNAELRFAYAPEFSLESASLVYNSHLDTTLTWNIPALYPGEKKNITVTFTLPANIALGTILPSVTSFKPLNTSDTTRNYYVLNHTAIGSYDPNDKQVFPAGNVTPEFISDQKDLEYIIRFQNTGTADAINVVVMDTISGKLDVATLTMISASHPYRYEQRGNKVSWTFENIHLPDMQTNEPESHGFIKFSIKPVSTLVLGEKITNKAGIVFDFNEAIITNKTETLIANLPVTTAVYTRKDDSVKMNVYPNPSADNVYVTFSTTGYAGKAVVIIRNNLGQEVSSRTVTVADGLNTLELDIHSFSSGMYYIEVTFNTECFGAKLIKH